MGCASGMIKYLVFLFNLIFAVAGLILLVFGVLYQLDVNNMKAGLSGGLVAVAPTAFIVIGAIIFIISFFGCCGAIKESTCMLTSYGIVLLVILILQVAIGALVFMQVKDNGTIKGEIYKSLSESLERAQHNDEAAMETFNILQHSLHCCGVNNPIDWGVTLPPSCCRKNKSPCLTAGTDTYDEGCARKLYTTLKDNFHTLGYVAIGLCATELIAAIFAFCLTSSIRNERRRGGYA